MDQLLTEREAAAMIADLKPATLSKWRRRRKGPRYLKLGSKVRYRLTDIEEWTAAQLIDPAQQPATLRKHRRKAA
jgi:predicted DNA-binding transcriptional regulator AlpA